jgi:hypothetical protein
MYTSEVQSLGPVWLVSANANAHSIMHSQMHHANRECGVLLQCNRMQMRIDQK